MLKRTIQLLTTLVATTLLPALAPAQTNCEPQWLPGVGSAGTYGTVYDMTRWDPDGPGPLQPRVVVFGNFAGVADAVAMQFAVYEPASDTWAALLPNTAFMDWRIDSTSYWRKNLASDASGGLYLINAYTPGSQGVFHRWDGNAWQAILSSSEFNYTRFSLASKPGGGVMVTGVFNINGTPNSGGLGVYDGTSWTGVALAGSPTARKVINTGDGAVILSGTFTSVEGVPAINVARYDGTSWTQVGDGTFTGTVEAEFPNGDLLGMTESTSSRLDFFRFTNGSWVPYAAPCYATYADVMIDQSGTLIVSGAHVNLTSGFPDPVGYGAMRWSGTAFVPMTPAYTRRVSYSQEPGESIFALVELPNGDLLAGGSFRWDDGDSVRNLARWDGARWHRLREGLDGPVEDIHVQPNGDILLAGRFFTAFGVDARSVVNQSGQTWQALSPPPPGGHAIGVEVRPNGNIVLAGRFTTNDDFSNFGGVTQWDGATWSTPWISATSTVITDSDLMANGDPVVTGDFSIPGNGSPDSRLHKLARWTSAGWVGMDFLTSGWTAFAVRALDDGGVVVGGDFPAVSGVPNSSRIIRRSPAGVWSNLGTGVDNRVYACVQVPNGDLIVGGWFTSAGGVPCNRIARWNGTAWSPLGTGMSGGNVYALLVMPNGDIIAGGDFLSAGGTPGTRRIARWNGSSWLAMGTGIDGEIPANSLEKVVRDLALHPNGDVLVAGDFIRVSGVVSAHFARWGCPSPTCDTIDFNHDTLFPDTLDIADFLAVFAGGVCDGQPPTDPPCNTDIDFNNDTRFPDTDDITALLRVFAGGPCL